MKEFTTPKRRRLAHRVCSLVLALALLFPMLQPLLGGFTALAAEVPTPVPGQNISISGQTGYYLFDNELYRYDVSSGSSAAVPLPGVALTGAKYVAYDAGKVFIADAKSVVYAYDAGDFSAPLWVYRGLENESVKASWNTDENGDPLLYPYEVGAEPYCKDGKLYVYSVCNAEDKYRSFTYVISIDIVTGASRELAVPTAGGEYYPKENAATNTILIGDHLLFIGTSLADVDLNAQTATVYPDPFDSGAAYDSTLAVLLGWEDGYSHTGSLMGQYPFVGIGQYGISLETAFDWGPVGESPVYASVSGTPVVFSVKEGKLIYEVFTGLDLVKKETGISTGALTAVTVVGDTAYLLDRVGKVYAVAVEQDGIDTGLRPTSDAAALDVEIAKLPAYNMSLTSETAVNELFARYSAMSDLEKRGVFKASTLLAAHTVIGTQRQQVDAINGEIAALPTPEALTVEKAAAVKAADAKRLALSPKANQSLVDTKLDALLAKVAAFDVMDAITALPDVDHLVVSDNSAVLTVRRQYENVANQWKGEVKNLGRLEAIEAKLESLLKDLEMAKGAYWSSMGTDNSNNTVVDSKLPISMENTTVYLGDKNAPVSAGDPIIVGERMYFAYGSTLYCYDLKGNKIMEAPLYSSIGFFSRITYGDGKIFVPLSSRMQAFDAQTLKPLWVSKDVGKQMVSTVTYNDGYVYSGFTSGGGGNTDPTNGAFFCISTKDEDPNASYEEKDFVWTSPTGGYYWAGATVVGNKIYYAGDAGVLYAHHLTEDITYDSYDLGGQVRANLVYDKDSGRIYVATKTNPNVYAIPLKADGTFDRAHIKKTKENVVGGLTGGLAVCNGRVYTPSGGMHASGALTVLDADTLDYIYAYEGIESQSIPLITTAYATAENDYTIYLYVNGMKDGVGYILRESRNQKAPYVQDTITGGTLYNSTSMKADQYGNLYWIGGSSSPGYMLTIFANDFGAFTAKDVENAVANLPDEAALTYEKKSQVEQAYDRYMGLSDEEKAKLPSAVSARILALKAKSDALTQALVDEADAAIAQIPDPVTADDAKLVEAAEAIYVRLLEADRLLVKGRAKLHASLTALSEQLKTSVPALIADIGSLPAYASLTLDHKAQVMGLYARYMALTQEGKARVTNADILLAAKEKMDILTDSETAAGLVPQIAALPSLEELSLYQEQRVTELYESYQALHDQAKPAATNAAALLAAYARVVELRTLVDGISNDIWNKLDPRNITLADKAVVEDLVARYQALRPVDREFVQYYDDVEYALQVIAELELAEGQKDKSPAPTGDSRNTMVYLGLVLCSGAVLAGAVVLGIKKKKSR